MKPLTRARPRWGGDPTIQISRRTLTLRDQGAILNTGLVSGQPAFVINAGSTLVADNTGSANLSNRLKTGNMNLAGGSLVLKGSLTEASSEIVGQLNLTTKTGSLVEVIPGPTQTASLFFSQSQGSVLVPPVRL